MFRIKRKFIFCLVLVFLTGCSTDQSIEIKGLKLLEPGVVTIVLKANNDLYESQIRVIKEDSEFKWAIGTDSNPQEKILFVNASGKLLENVWLLDPTGGKNQLLIQHEDESTDIEVMYFLSFNDSSVCISTHNNNNCVYDIELE